MGLVILGAQVLRAYYNSHLYTDYVNFIDAIFIADRSIPGNNYPGAAARNVVSPEKT